MKSAVATLIAIVAMATVGWNFDSVRKEMSPPAKPAGLDAHESNAATSLLGQFRTSSSTWLWLKTDLYLHNGVEMRALTDAEKLAGRQEVKDGDGWHEAIGDHESLVTSIPDEGRDFRGVFGDIDRATSAYAEMGGHKHNDPIAALPLFRLMTWVDPNFIPGWLTGAMVIAEDHSDASFVKAIAYLREGLANNPESIAIRTDIARMMISHNRDIVRATPLLEQGVRLATLHRQTLSEDELESAIDCFRWLALCYGEVGRTGDSIRTAELGLSVVGDDPVLERQANPQPTILTPLKSDSTEAAKPHASSEQGHSDH